MSSPDPEDLLPSILIVDDMPANIRVLADTLKSDYRVRVATSGAKALEIAAGSPPPDLILLDVMMPEMDGYEVCRRLKDDPRTSTIPIIFVTAKDEAEEEAHGLGLGAVDYIAKPFHLPIVRARVRTHVNLKRKTDLLDSLASLDGLTHIPNRRRFDEALKLEWARAAREGTSLAVAMLDVDYFKPYNDHYGHGRGDECLRRVADALSARLQRPADLAARYGGEEFVLLLPDTDAAGALALAESCRAAVSALCIPHDYSAAADHVTLSIGVAATQPPSDGASLLLARADEALYRAKSEGRNRVCV
ncbi:PleD family two-component system response regulator [Allochromatium humboldtianum]|uniref:diguanylate cyclase n=1 Tax=Allochromatium humboldtianum TaxID=504901 RepID=A0A850RD04_9GAMM|nr:PleD family two-component system response regulator [Allochromatium humboldtianum]NVZ08840.1 PleD family two-component system response regulator [Allochromatium humboldtianum]